MRNVLRRVFGHDCINSSLTSVFIQQKPAGARDYFDGLHEKITIDK